MFAWGLLQGRPFVEMLTGHCVTQDGAYSAAAFTRSLPIDPIRPEPGGARFCVERYNPPQRMLMIGPVRRFLGANFCDHPRSLHGHVEITPLLGFDSALSRGRRCSPIQSASTSTTGAAGSSASTSAMSHRTKNIHWRVASTSFQGILPLLAALEPGGHLLLQTHRIVSFGTR